MTRRRGVVLSQASVSGLTRLIGDETRWTEVTVAGVSMPVFIRLARRKDASEIVCTGVIVGVKPPGTVVRATDLRIPLAQVATEIQGLWKILGDADGLLDQHRPPAAALMRPGRQGRDRAFFEQLAAAYRRALELEEWRGAPTKYLREHVYHVSDSKLRYWLNKARELGVLGRAPRRGTAGERPTRRKGGRK